MPILPDTEFYSWHFMPYVALPEEIKQRESLWVDVPNQIYDPKTGHALYKRYLSELVLADKLGFDGLAINEHHSTPYSMMPIPNLIAAALIPQTTRAKIAVMGTPAALEYPHRLAETYAMLDVMSGGRLEIAIPLGTGMEYWVAPINPATARERQVEAIEIMLKAWTQDGPLQHFGKHFTYHYLNTWPRPYQKPHPKCYIVGTGSPETIELAAKLGFGYSSTFIPITQQLAAQQYLRERARDYGHNLRPDQFPMSVMVYIGDTDERALAEYEPHVRYFFEVLLRPGRFLQPPGYLSLDQFRKRNARPDAHGHFDWDLIRSSFRLIAGSARTVTDQVEQWAEECGSSRIIFYTHLADMPHWKVVRTLTALAEEVIPALRRRAAPALKQAAE